MLEEGGLIYYRIAFNETSGMIDDFQIYTSQEEMKEDQDHIAPNIAAKMDLEVKD